MSALDWMTQTAASVWGGAGDSSSQKGEPERGLGDIVSAALPGSAVPLSGDAATKLFGHLTDSESEAPGLPDRIGGVASGAADAAGGAANFVSDGYQKATDFKPLMGALDKGVDWAEKKSDQGGEELVESARGIPVLEQLAQGSAFMNHVLTQAGGGLVKGAGDVVGGAANAFFHPIDTAAGLAGMVEHSGLPGVGTAMKTAHGAYDLAVNGGGQYGNSVGDLANHVLNPLQSGEDDQKAQMKMVTSILAPGELDKKPGEKGVGWDVWKDKPAEAIARAAANVAPILLGAGEGAAGEDAAQAARTETTLPALESMPPEVPPRQTLPGLGPVESTELPPQPQPPQRTQPGLGPAEPGPKGPIRKSQLLTGDAASEAVDSQPMNSVRERLLNDRTPPPPTPSPEELLEGLERRPVEEPVRPSPSEPSVDELLRNLSK